MKICVKDEFSLPAYEEGRGRYVEIVPCSKCSEYRWSDNEKTAVLQAVDFSRLLADFISIRHYDATGSVSTSDWRYLFDLNCLINPFKELINYDGGQIRLLRGILRIAGFAGVSDINSKYLIAAYRVIGDLILHIHNEHRDEIGEPPSFLNPLDDGSAPFQPLPVAPLSCFEPDYPDWVDLEQLFFMIPEIRGLSFEHIHDYCKKALDQAKNDNL